ncbi:Prolactin regulatory element-binding protein [Blattella germanica]|nr:Prolactin regulatory element-binding protein [Blattella germanica]
MAPNRRSQEGLLARVNFPLYTVQMLTSRHVLVGGGGGSSNTGVANGFEIFELSHNGEKFIAEEVIRHETGPSVVMNCASHNNGRHMFLVAGQESHCQLYNVNMEIADSDSEDNVIKPNSEAGDTNEVRKRSKKSSVSESEDTKKEAKKEDTRNNKKEAKTEVDDNSNGYRRLMFQIKPNDSIQTDFSAEEPLQRVVRIAPSGKMMVTGGTDGHVRLWNFPSMKQKVDIKAHSKEVDDVDISPNDKSVVSISKDGLAIIWNAESGKKQRELSWTFPEGCRYLYKRCRFGLVEEDNSKTRLFMITNPLGKPGKKQAFLQLWSPDDGTLRKSEPCNESLSALAVSDEGRFVAVGTMFSGSVSVYIAFSLQRALHVPGAHSMFVTGLEFLPMASGGPPITSCTETAVVSISVDNRVCIHSLAYRSFVSSTRRLKADKETNLTRLRKLARQWQGSRLQMSPSLV